MSGTPTDYDILNPSFYLKKCMLDRNLGLCDIRYIKDIINTKVSMFSYEGLPGKLTPQILELSLVFRNNLCFYYVSGTQEWILCYYTYGGLMDYYFKPVKVNLIALNGQIIANEVPYEDIILVRDNIMDIIPIVPITQYIERIKSVEATIDQELNIISLPIVLIGNEKTKSQMLAIANKAGVRNPFVIGDKTIVDSAKSFNISVPISPLDLYELKSKYKNECLQSLGIYSVEEKRERLLKQEVTNQNDYTENIYQAEKLERQKFIKELNKRGNMNIKLIELYDMGVDDSADEEYKNAEATAEGTANGIKNVDPTADVGKGGNPNGK